MSRSEPSLSSFSTAVEAIYDCALDASHWKDALRVIGELTDSPCGGAGMTDYAHAGSMRPVGEVFRAANINRDRVINSPYYHDWAKPQDLGDLIGVNAVRAGQSVGGVSVFRKSSQPRYGKRIRRRFGRNNSREVFDRRVSVRRVIAQCGVMCRYPGGKLLDGCSELLDSLGQRLRARHRAVDR